MRHRWAAVRHIKGARDYILSLVLRFTGELAEDI
jgi:hypothetical protein